MIKEKSFWPKGFTINRLERVRFDILADRIIINDLLYRHGANEFMPEQFKEKHPEHYSHAMGNFAGNILYKMNKLGVIK